MARAARRPPPGAAHRMASLLLPVLLLLAWGPLWAAAAGDACTALQLLKPNDERNRTGLRVVDSTLAYIEALEHPVAVVAIVGPYHTGKSFLLNQVAWSIPGVAAGSAASVGDARHQGQPEAKVVPPSRGPGQAAAKKEIFGIGRGVDPETSGIWMYHREMVLPSHGPGPVDVLFLDTEGFSVSNVTEAYDAQVFAAATLLSSLVLYNSMHVLHANELEYLDLLVHNTQLFSIKTALRQEEEAAAAAGKGGMLKGLGALLAALTPGGGGGSSVASLAELLRLPPLLMTVQAFTMNLQDEDCTQWLSRLIAAPVRSSLPHPIQPRGGRAVVIEQPPSSDGGGDGGDGGGGGSAVQHMGLGTLFPSVACQTLFLPATSRAELHNLADVPLSAMTADFRRDLAALDEAILHTVEPKRWRGGAPLSGAAFAALVRLVAEALASGELSDIPGRWELYEGHLRASSVRAALTAFDSELRRLHTGATNGTRPLTGPEMSRALHEAEAYAKELCRKLLVGLDRSYHRAAREVGAGAAQAGEAAVRRNAAAVASFLRDAADATVAVDRDAIQRFIAHPHARAPEDAAGEAAAHPGGGAGGLPLPERELEEWIAGRERDAMTQFKRATAVFKDDPAFSPEAKALGERLRAGSDKLRLRNQEAMEEYLERQREGALARYRRELEADISGEGPSGSKGKEREREGLGPAPRNVHTPEALQAFHAAASAAMLAAFEAGAAPFKAEKAHGLHLTQLKADAQAVLSEAQAANGRRVAAFCDEHRAQLLAAVAAQAARVSQVLDEEELEKGLAAAGKLATSEALAARVGEALLRRTAEGQAAERSLGEGVAALCQQARMALAEKIRRVLDEPLSEICLRIIQAKCDAGSYRTVRGFERDVEKQCAPFVRKHEVGRRLSKAMLKNVLTTFIGTDLAACRAAVSRRERRTNFWRKVTLAGCGILAFFAYVKIKDPFGGHEPGMRGNGMLQRPQDRGQQQKQHQHQRGGGFGRLPPFNPAARR